MHGKPVELAIAPTILSHWRTHLPKPKQSAPHWMPPPSDISSSSTSLRIISTSFSQSEQPAPSPRPGTTIETARPPISLMSWRWPAKPKASDMSTQGGGIARAKSGMAW